MVLVSCVTHTTAFIDGLKGIPDDDRARLKALCPTSYTGLASTLAEAVKKL
jgi:hypothetical protein